MAIQAAPSMADYMEAVARKQKLEPPEGYGYKADIRLGVGCFLEERTSCRVLEKPITIPSGQPNNQGYMVLFAYCRQEGMESILQGQLPPMLPATSKEPKEFESLAAIADNFGAKDPQAAAANSQCCVVLRVPAALATQAETPGRDLWIVRFDQDIVSPFLQVVKEGNVEKVKQGLEQLSGDIVDEDGVSALMMAAFGGWQETCQALVDKKADVNGVEPFGGKTPLMFAAQGGFADVVGMLLSLKADPTQADREGQTPLMWAAVAGKAAVARLLAPVSPKDAVNGEGLTAAAVAQKMGHEEVVKVLS